MKIYLKLREYDGKIQHENQFSKEKNTSELLFSYINL